MTTASENMRLWNAVSKTNPLNTKHVNQRGGFTAINAHSQIMEATSQFGPLGIGWGYDAGAPIFTPDGLVIVPVTLWHGSRENVFGPQYGGAATAFKGKPDSDAPKKAGTDALTKLLSQLGFNADVFLGMYDDNKYVAAMDEEFNRPKPKKLEGPYTSKTALWAAVREFDSELRGCSDSDTLEPFLAIESSKALLAQLGRDAPQLLDKDASTPSEFEAINDLIERKRNEFNNQQEAA